MQSPPVSSLSSVLMQDCYIAFSSGSNDWSATTETSLKRKLRRNSSEVYLDQRAYLLPILMTCKLEQVWFGQLAWNPLNSYLLSVISYIRADGSGHCPRKGTLQTTPIYPELQHHHRSFPRPILKLLTIVVENWTIHGTPRQLTKWDDASHHWLWERPRNEW